MDYKKVIDDFRSGKIDRDKWSVVMDNDSGYWRYTGDDALSLPEREELERKMTAEYGKPDGYRDIVDVLNAAGVPAEWC